MALALTKCTSLGIDERISRKGCYDENTYFEPALTSRSIATMRIFRHLLSLVLACGSVALHAQPKPIVIWGRAPGPDDKGIERVMQVFNKRHPQYKIRALSMGAGAMNPQKLMTAIVGKVAPDLVYQDRFTISDWASRNAFIALDPFIERDKSDPLCPKADGYYEAPWKEAMWDGKVYGIPSGVDDRVLYYNKTLFAKHADELRAAGLDPTRPPHTWSDVLKYSKVLTEKNPDGTLKVAGFMPNYGNSWLYLYSFQMNGTFLSPDGRHCTLNSKEVQEALKFMKDGYDIIGGYGTAKNFESGFQNNENDAFIVGKVAMKIDGDWIINSLARYGPSLQFAVGPAPEPDDRVAHKGAFANEKDTDITWSGGFSWCIPLGAKNVDGAWEFVKFATSLEGRRIEMEGFREAERRRGRLYVPRLAALQQANDLILSEFTPADDRISAALHQHIALLPFGRMRPATFAGQVLWDEHVRATENACNGSKPIPAALQDAQDTVQRELDSYYRTDSMPVVDLRIPMFIGIGLLVVVLLGAWYALKRMRLGRLAKSDAKWAYLFISPWLIGFLVLTIGPMLASLFFSFTQYNVLSPARWAGGQNYVDMVTTDKAMTGKALLNVIYLGGIGVPMGILSGLAIAMLLNSAVRGMRYYRTLFYMPAIVPVVASAVLWNWVLTADPNKGLLNAGWRETIGAWMNLPPPGWLTMPEYTKQSLIIMGMWGAGSGMLLWLAGLKGVPQQLYEAASIDGATPSKQLWSITLPQLSPIIFFNVVVGFIGAIQEFDRPYVLLNGENSPSDSLLMPVMHLFNNGFRYFKMGYASALAWVIFLVIVVLTFIQFKMARRWVHYEADAS